MATPVTEQLNILSQQMQSSTTGLQTAYLQNQTLGLERAKLEATMNDPVSMLKKQQAQQQLDKIQQEMKTPYNALNALESRDPTDIQYKIANDIYLKIAEGISQSTGRVVRYVNDPKSTQSGQFLIGTEKGETPISNYDMFSKYGSIYDAVTKANYDPERALEANMVQAKLAWDKAKKEGNAQEVEKQQKIFEGLATVLQDPKQLLGIHESKLNYLIDVDAQNKAINPDYKGMDKAITATQDKIKNLVKNIDKKEERQWDLYKLGVQQQFTAQQNALARSDAWRRLMTSIGYQQNKDARDQADKFAKEGIPQLAEAGLTRMGYSYNKDMGQWGTYGTDSVTGKKTFKMLSPQFVDNYYNAMGNFAISQFKLGVPINMQVSAMKQANVPKKVYEAVRDNTSARQPATPTKTGGAILRINR